MFTVARAQGIDGQEVGLNMNTVSPKNERDRPRAVDVIHNLPRGAKSTWVQRLHSVSSPNFIYITETQAKSSDEPSDFICVESTWICAAYQALAFPRTSELVESQPLSSEITQYQHRYNPDVDKDDHILGFCLEDWYRALIMVDAFIQK